MKNMKSTTLHRRRIVVLRVFLGVALCFNYLLSTTNVVFRHHQKESSTEEGSFLDGTAPPPTTRRGGNADERNIANNAPGMEEAQARRDLIDCGIIDDHRGNNGTTADDPSSSHHLHSSCDLTDLRWGTPTILISLGRSGSTATWQLMSAMTGDHTFPATEDTGSSTAMSIRIFDEVFGRVGDGNGKCWVQELLCRHQGSNRARDGGGRPMAGLYGFKWKPYSATFGSARSAQALAWLSRNPHVKVVRNVRNPLDVIISRYKHRDRSVVAHCAAGDDACSDSHKTAKPTLPTKGGRLVRLIDEIEEESNAAGRLLDELDVPHLDVKYEDLYFAPDIAIEWRRVFKFLGVGPSEDDGNLTSSILAMRMEHQATSNHSTPIREKVQNYVEVEDALRGTEYEVFL